MRDRTESDFEDSAITDGLVRSAWIDVAEAENRLRTICRPKVPTTELHWVDEALAQLAQARTRLDMAIPEGVAAHGV